MDHNLYYTGHRLILLANYSVSYFQKLIDRFTAGTLTLSGILFTAGSS